MNWMKSVLISLFVGIAVSCISTRETNRKQLNFISDNQMNRLGEEAYQEMLSQKPRSKNSKLTKEVVEIGRHIAEASKVNYEWEFNLFESKEINAFCLPGGKIGVFTGILPVAQTNAGLAAILGHEVAHAVLRHSAERLSQQLVMNVGMTAAGLTIKDEKKRSMILAALGLGLQLGVALPYSRQHESEADKVGLKYMVRAGYPPEEAVDLWHRMAELGSRPPEILSTHPDPVKRAEELRKYIPEIKKEVISNRKIPTKKLSL